MIDDGTGLRERLKLAANTLDPPLSSEWRPFSDKASAALMREAAEALSAVAPPPVLEGWVPVPKVPTDAMLAVWLTPSERAGGDSGGDTAPWLRAFRRYGEMLAASPAAPALAEGGEADIFSAYKTWPADIRAKLSCHDLRRMGGWTPATSADDWRIDTSAGGPILVHKNCSVIEGDQARYVLGLIAADKDGTRPAPAQPEGGEPLTDTFIQHVPDKCDRIIWRGQYHSLPLSRPAPAQQAWQPIETAPLGDFLVCVQGWVTAAYRNHDEPIKSMALHEPFSIPPTHWQPMPTAALTSTAAKAAEGAK